MSVEMVGGLLAFAGLFGMFVILPSKLRKKSPEQD